MDDLVHVQVGHAVRDLLGPLQDLLGGEAGAAVQEFKQRTILAVLHYHAVVRRQRAHAAETHCNKLYRCNPVRYRYEKLCAAWYILVQKRKKRQAFKKGTDPESTRSGLKE